MNNNKDVKKIFEKWPMVGEREIELINEVTKSTNWWRMNGDKVSKFEKLFSQYHNANHCLCVTNGTHAIELVLSALNIGDGDEVIIPANTFISTAVAVIYCNATPVIVDVDPSTFCMDPKEFEKAITKKTKAVIPVHMAGHICDMDEISRIAKKYNVDIIEDAAHAHGSEWNNVKIGTFGQAATFSFQNGKIVTCGEGGAIITNNDMLYEKMFVMHNVGRPKGDRVYNHVELGSNYRMSEFQAAILIAQLERLEQLNMKREKNAQLLDNLLSNIKGITPQGRDNRVTLHTHYMYMFYYDSVYFNNIKRNKFVDMLIDRDIPAFISYPVISDTKFYKENNFRGYITNGRNYDETELPNSRKISEEVVWLPHNLLIGDEKAIRYIADVISEIQNGKI